MFMRIAWLFLPLALLTGCQGRDRDIEKDVKDRRAEWRKLPDGSQFAAVTVSNGENSEAMRCWPKGQGFSCIDISRFEAVSSYSVDFDELSSLPEYLIGASSTVDGYSCGELLGYNETIARGGKELISNRLDGETRRWDRRFVAQYMRDNGVKGTAWFPCLEVLRKVTAGSLETLSTSSITRSLAGA
jgi:hypothetical protein